MHDWQPPPGSVVHGAARRLDPHSVARGYSLALALCAGVAIAWELTVQWQAWRGSNLPRARWIESYAPLALLAWVMSLGASKRCFGFGAAFFAALVLGAAVAWGARMLSSPSGTNQDSMSYVAVAVAAAAGTLLVLPAFVWPQPVQRYRWVAGLALAALAALLYAVVAERIPQQRAIARGLMAGVAAAGALSTLRIRHEANPPP